METFDYEDQFEKMKKDVKAAFSKALGIKARGTGRELIVRDVWVDDNRDPSDWESQRDAVRKDSTWGVPVYASLDLVDSKNGKVLSSSKRIRVATLPKNTNFGSFIVDGKHYQVSSQFRRKPGIYVTEQKNRELKTEVNIAGRPFDIVFDRSKSTFGLVRSGPNNTPLPLYPILSRLGVSDAMLAKAWGSDVLEINKNIAPKKATEAVTKAATYFTSEQFESPDDAATAIQEYLEQTELRPEVTESTVGTPYKNASPLAIVAGSSELMKANRGERRPDDRQALEYKKTLSVADLFRERLFKANGELAPKLNQFRSRIGRKLNNRKAPPDSVDRVLQVNELGNLLTQFYTQSELSNTTDQTNPINMINGLSKITIMGEGGVKNERAVREEERAVHPSHLGFLDPIHTPDSSKIGVVVNMPLGVVKSGDELKTMVIDPRTKKTTFASPRELKDKVIAFPDQFVKGQFVDKKVKALNRGEIAMVPASKVDVVLATPKQAFSLSSNTVPFLPSTHGIRAQMAAKMLDQALPLTNREAPLVQVKMGKKSIEDTIGDGFSVKAQQGGVIEAVTPNRISIRTKDGVVEQPLYNNLPLNGKSFLHAQPRVKPGDQVEVGQVVADSNFTDNGSLAIGTNLRAAYVPYKGYNFEDGIVITESAAKKLTSEHMHSFEASADKGDIFSLKSYVAAKPDLTLEQQEKLDADGVIRKGQVLTKGDPIWVGTRENRYDPDYLMMKRLVPKLSPRKGYKETWNKDHDGVVVDVVKRGKKVKVYVKTQEPAQVGDKLTNREAAKGIITKIIPDGEAPHTEDGRPVEILLNPHGIVTRMNPSQILEVAAAKIAESDGKPFKVDNFSGENYAKSIAEGLAKRGLEDTEVLYDPHSKEPLGKVLVGPQFTMKLSKQATSQYSARSEGRYDINKSPLKGGEEGSKALDLLSMYSMLSHGARANLREMATYKAEKNDQFWNWVSVGPGHGIVKPLPSPTFAYKKFEAYMRGAGVNMDRRGSKMVLAPLTDREISNLSNGKVEEPLFLRAKDLGDEKGGLTDPNIFGRMKDKWGHIDLAEPIPNPVFEAPIKVLTGLKNPQFNSLIRGERFIDPETGEWSEEGGLTGGPAIQKLLSMIDVDQEIAVVTDEAKKATTPAKLDAAHKRLKYLHALKKNNLRPEEAYIQNKVPVIPPQFRPIIEMGDGKLSTPGINTLYRDVGLVNNELAWQKDVPFLPNSVTGELRENLYKSVKAVTGLGDPIAFYPAKRKPKGFIEQLKGQQAKQGFFQYNVIRRQQNLVGRGTIIPEPKLGTDEVGIPEDMAWTLYERFIIRRLVNSGKTPIAALDEVNKRTPLAKSALDAEMASRPVLLNRAPSLHKFNIMAFKPQLTDGKAIKIPPLVVKGFNADFDGDTMTVHIPVLPDAVKEAENLLPSNNLYNPGSGDVMIVPKNEANLGIYLMSQTPEGRKKILEELPEQMRSRYDQVLSKKLFSQMLNDLAKEMPRDYGKVVDRLKQLGDEHTYRVGFTVGLNDLLPNLPGRDKVFKSTNSAIRKLDLERPEDRDKAVAIVEAANQELDAILANDLPQQQNNLHTMVTSGARGNLNQLKQTISAPFMVNDHRGNVSPIPITNSFAEGLPFSDYWQTTYGARSVAMDKQLQTADPGAFTKDVMASASNVVIAKDDCGTRRGVALDITDSGSDAVDRFLAADIKIGGTTIANAGAEVTPTMLNTLREQKIHSVKVRSPLTCALPKGVCAKCFGKGDGGELPSIGDNVGAESGQALSEPLTQMTLRTFHTGGLAGTRGIITGYEKIDKLLKMPQIKRGRATLARASGTVEDIRDAPGKTGKEVLLAGQKEPHFIPKELWDSSKVRVGTKVKKGDILSLGLVQPNELADLKGMLPAQTYIVDQIHEAYKSQGVPLKRRPIETVLRSATNTTTVLDPGDSDFLHGDVAPWTVVEDFNNKTIGKKKLDDAVGHVLREEVPGAREGSVITEQIKKGLERLGRSEVTVGPKPVVHKPFLKGIERIPMLRDDWMSQLGYRELAKGIVGGAATAAETDIHDYAPIPAFAYGAEFGDAPSGKSKTEGVY